MGNRFTSKCAPPLSADPTLVDFQGSLQEGKVLQTSGQGSELDCGNYIVGPQQPNGLAVIVNIEHFPEDSRRRKGSPVDVDLMSELSIYLGLRVISHRNCKAREVLSLLRYHRSVIDERCDVFVCFLMSHGGSGYIEGSDSEKLWLDEVFELFSNENCEALRNKPKVFFIQACRGKQPNHGIPVYHPEHSPVARDCTDSIKATRCIGVLNKFSDMFMAYSSRKGYASLRHEELGSYFIKAIYDVFMENAAKRDLETMLKQVNRRLCGKVSATGEMFCPGYDNILWRGKLFFRINPNALRRPVDRRVEN